MNACVLYLASQVPKRSETFVYREIFGLREAGLAIKVASLYAPERGLGDERLDALADEALPVYGAGKRALLIDAARSALQSPLRAARILALSLCDGARADDLRGIARLKPLAQAVASLALARRARGAGLTIRHIHAHFAHAPASVGMYLAMYLRAPFSFTGHAADLFRDRALLRVKLRRAAFVSCISEWHRDFYRALAPRPDAAYPVVRCGVDIREFSPRERRASGEPPLVFSVGRLIPKKGFDVLLRALAQLAARQIPFQAAIAGDGPERERLHALCNALALTDRVQWLGACPNRAVRDWLARADIFVLPCQISRDGDRDGIPVVLMEAMAMGVCAISGDLPAIRELIEPDRSGLLVPPGDADALAHALEELLRDPARRAELAAAGLERVRAEFSLEVNVTRLLPCFHHG